MATAPATATTSRALFTPLGVRLTGYIPHWPHPPQEAFLWLDCKEALYGGAAGGGKSDALLMAALQYADVPGYAALILRKTYAELGKAEALMARAKAWLSQTDATWNENDHVWRFPSGARLEFGHLQHSESRYAYQSAEYQYIGFDELTEFDEHDYRFLFSRLRRPAEGALSNVPLRMRAATNPGGKGHRWVKARFVDEPNTAARAFIPARLPDNPSIDQAAYLEALAELDSQTRAQLLDGDWNARPAGDWYFDTRDLDAVEQLGASFDQAREQGEMPEPDGQAVQLGIDWGESTHAVVLWPLEGGGMYVTDEVTVTSTWSPDSSRRMIAAAARTGWPLDEARYDSSHPDSARGFESVTAAMPDPPGMWAVSFSKRKGEAAKYLRALTERTGKEHTVRVLAISPTGCPELLRQLRALEADPDGTAWRKDTDQHGPDALIAAAAPIAKRRMAALST